MRIIGGRLKGHTIPVKKGFKGRPTTDFAREGLFNLLAARKNPEGTVVFDLFSGTGALSMEFLSRGCTRLYAADLQSSTKETLKLAASKWPISGFRFFQTDIRIFLKKINEQADIIFADPPYNFSSLALIPQWVLTSQKLKPDGLFILEHGPAHIFSDHPDFLEMRKYGKVHFSFFRATPIPQ